MAATLRVTPDSELATETAIRIRIDMLRKEIPVQQVLNRIKRLEARLPKTTGGGITPAINAGLLVSKRDIGWSGSGVQNYASPSCSYQG